MKRIIIDMDEVIADPMGEMIEWYRKSYKQEVDWDKMLVGSYDRINNWKEAADIFLK